MVRTTNHQVLQQVVDLRVDSEAIARELHAELFQDISARIAPVLDDVFSAVCPDDVTLRIDRVEVDIGVVTRESLYSTIERGLREQLHAALEPWSRSVRAPAHPGLRVERLNTEQVALERLSAFLEAGAVTARYRTSRDELDEILLRMVDSAPAALVRLLRRLPRDRAVRRLATQFSRRARIRLTATFTGIHGALVEALLDDWYAILPELHRATEVLIPSATREAIDTWFFGGTFGFALGQAAPQSASPETISLHLVQGVHIQGSKGADLSRVVFEAARRALSSERPLRRALTGGLGGFEPPPLVLPPVISGAGVSQTTPPPKAMSHEPIAREPSAPLAVLGGTEERTYPRAAPDAGGVGSIPSTPSLQPTRGDAPSFEAPPSRSRSAVAANTVPRFIALQRESLWVANAGLVVLWPLLPAFFAALALTDGKRFSDEAARERAVLLTAHLADSADEWAEHQLVLSKILCGYPLFEPLATRLDVREQERAEARALLEAVLEHWSALKSTSVAGLRQAFLGREGRLTLQSTGWKLDIPRVGYDVLVDKLPWSLGLVLLPWMDQPLYVEW